MSKNIIKFYEKHEKVIDHFMESMTYAVGIMMVIYIILCIVLAYS